jgi:hypothetical protein
MQCSGGVAWLEGGRSFEPDRRDTELAGHDKPRTKTHQAHEIELLERARLAIERQRATTLLANGAIFWNPNNQSFRSPLVAKRSTPSMMTALKRRRTPESIGARVQINTSP